MGPTTPPGGTPVAPPGAPARREPLADPAPPTAPTTKALPTSPTSPATPAAQTSPTGRMHVVAGPDGSGGSDPAPPVLSISTSTLARPAATAINAATRPAARPTVADPASPDGFAAAFPALFTLAYQVAYRVLGDRGDAEDVAQEALARALLRWTSLADRPEGWIVRVSSNLAIDRYRRRRRSVPAAVDGPAGADSASADRVDLAASLGRLPKRQREVVVLRYLADWSEQEVANELGCSVGNVKSSGSRGIRALRAKLGGAGGGGASEAERRGGGGGHVPAP